MEQFITYFALGCLIVMYARLMVLERRRIKAKKLDAVNYPITNIQIIDAHTEQCYAWYRQATMVDLNVTNGTLTIHIARISHSDDHTQA